MANYTCRRHHTDDPIFEMLETRRLELNRSLESVCNEAGIASIQYYDWANGKTAPTLRTFRRLLDALQLNIVFVPRGKK